MNLRNKITYVGSTAMSPKCELCGRSYPMGLIPLSQHKAPAVTTLRTKRGIVILCAKCVNHMPRKEIRRLIEEGLTGQDIA
ncbi:MAG: hypothetical protein K6E81_05490 [Lachnospiraceae bacterium]|nr:hypothetical protein [Lachnospiraceae bacterium]